MAGVLQRTRQLTELLPDGLQLVLVLHSLIDSLLPFPSRFLQASLLFGDLLLRFLHLLLQKGNRIIFFQFLQLLLELAVLRELRLQFIAAPRCLLPRELLYGALDIASWRPPQLPSSCFCGKVVGKAVLPTQLSLLHLRARGIHKLLALLVDNLARMQFIADIRLVVPLLRHDLIHDRVCVTLLLLSVFTLCCSKWVCHLLDLPVLRRMILTLRELCFTGLLQIIRARAFRLSAGEVAVICLVVGLPRLPSVAGEDYRWLLVGDLGLQFRAYLELDGSSILACLVGRRHHPK